jgi:replication factor A1
MQAQTHDLAPHIEAIRKALGPKANDLDEQDLKDELAKYLEYGVPADQAVRTILRHHGAPPGPAPRGPSTQERLPLAQLPPQGNVNLKVRILTLQSKSVSARGEQKEILWGLLGDESGTAPYTSWRPLEGLQKGDVLEVQGAYTKEFNGQVQVNFGDRTRLAKLAADAIPRTPVAYHDVVIGELKEGSRGIRVTGRIVNVAERQVTVQGQAKTVFGGAIADATGKIEFTAWSDHHLESGQAVTIEGGYIRSYRGVAQYNFDAEAKVSPASADMPSVEVLLARPPMAVRELVARGGGSDLHLVGSILEVRPGSGLVLRCSTGGCTRVLVGGLCRLHNKVDGVPDIRLKAILDDGTGSVGLVAGREVTEGLLGKTLEQCKKEAQDAFRPDLIQEQLRERVVGRVFSVRGNALSDDYGITFIVRSMQPHDEDRAAAATAALAALEAQA